ncbi:succinate--CoA ligase subunit beta [Oxynema sp. CENA135]|uniref:succinate--CoA ligase subunit beta n=1 Tax=Oxynema sp. CENA135 TaxID=984206 RepID=UPI00190DE2E6|nr:succinate--CoA ligase subunit beta [Oxynema sp. CENA135]MBK4729931.1 succinate--CoA ligase subunit beta [Oxynema sp. CENA135]
MDLLEYQAKELFREIGIPVLPGQRIDRPQDLKGLKIPYPVVLKSQVRAGGRGRVGGIKFVANTIDAVAAAHTIFHLPITGEYPEVLLAEAKYNTDRELYLAVVLDREARRPVLLGSRQGGTSTESAMEDMQQVVVDREFSPFYARRLTLKMGCSGPLIQSVSEIVEKMYYLFVEKDLDLVEINPLGISPSGEVMALDGKVTANDRALSRHHDLARLIYSSCRTPENGTPSRSFATGIPGDRQPSPPWDDLNLIPLDGNIGILCNGAGLTMATLDLVCEAGGKPANFLNLGGESRSEATPEQIAARVEKGLALVCQDKTVKAVLVNLLGGIGTCDLVAEAIANYLKRISRQNTTATSTIRLPKLIVRLMGTQFDRAQQILDEVEVTLVENLDRAVEQVVSAARKG